MLLIKVQTRGNKQGCIGDIICTFHKQSCTVTDTLITPERQYSYRKRITRGHITFSNRQGAFHWSSSYPGFMLEFQHRDKFEGKKRYLQTQGRNIFCKVTL